MSCSSTPCKVVECIGKTTMHAVRIVRCQNPLPPVFQRRRRRAAVPGCDLQCPAEMFSRMAQADAQSVVTANPVIEGADIFELLRQRWCGFRDAGLKAASDLTGQPRLALRTTADHDGVGA